MGGGYNPNQGPHGDSFGYWLTHASFPGSDLFQTGWGDRALRIAQNVSLGIGLTAGAAVGSYYAYAAVYAKAGLAGVLSAAGAKGLGGAISGGLGPVLANRGWGAGGRGAVVGGVAGAVNPFGGLGAFGAFGRSVGAGLNSTLGNIITQTTTPTDAAGGAIPISLPSAFASGGIRFGFGMAAGGFSSNALGPNVAFGLAGGVASGLGSGAASAAGAGSIGVIFIAP